MILSNLLQFHCENIESMSVSSLCVCCCFLSFCIPEYHLFCVYYSFVGSFAAIILFILFGAIFLPFIYSHFSPYYSINLSIISLHLLKRVRVRVCVLSPLFFFFILSSNRSALGMQFAHTLHPSTSIKTLTIY